MSERASERACVCVCVYVGVSASVSVGVALCMRAYMRAHMCVNECAYVSGRKRERGDGFVNARLHACVRMRACVGACVGVCEYMHECAHECVRIALPVSLQHGEVMQRTTMVRLLAKSHCIAQSLQLVNSLRLPCRWCRGAGVKVALVCWWQPVLHLHVVAVCSVMSQSEAAMQLDLRS